MKYSAIALITAFLFIGLFTACVKEPDTPEFLINDKLSTIKIDGEDSHRFYYDQDVLIEVQSDYNIWDTINNVAIPMISHSYFEYENEKLARVINGNSQTNIEYVGDDLIISNFHNQFPEAILTYKNYQDAEEFRIEYFLTSGFEPQFSPSFDDDGNFLIALDDAGNSVEESFPGYYHLSQYYGEYDYNSMKSQYSNFDREVQLYFYQKPFNHCVKSIQKPSHRIEYQYDYNTNDLPISSKAMRIINSTNDTFFLATKEYIYE